MWRLLAFAFMEISTGLARVPLCESKGSRFTCKYHLRACGAPAVAGSHKPELKM